jgi:hypothetical protein
VLLLIGCSDVSPTNPYDPVTPRSQQARATVLGTVRLQRYGDAEALLGATLELRVAGGEDPVATAHPDEQGRFGLEATPGSYTLTASAVGYLSETVPARCEAGEVVDLGIVELLHESQGPTAVSFVAHVRLRGEEDHAGTAVRLDFAGRDRAFASAVTDAAGRIDVPAAAAERYRMVIDRPGWRNPKADAVYLWSALGEAAENGQFTDESAPGEPIVVELLPASAPVCIDGESGACIETEGVCADSFRVCANGMWSPCVARADERCDGLDDDCDGMIDEELDDRHACHLPNAAAVCTDGACVVEECLGDAVDLDARAPNGCECVPLGAEGDACNGLDEDCDGAADEDVDKQTDPRHCGACGRACDFANARADCEAGQCRILGCEPGFHDFDGDVKTGCEAACSVTEGGVELCDYTDNDCDGSVDEDDQPLDENPVHCGACENDCRRFAHGAFGCEAGGCVVRGCDPGFRDVDGDVTTGCEYACDVTNGGIEACDGLDNDCDARIDEETDLFTDTRNCGACGDQCTPPNAAPACVDGRCRIGACDLGWVDANHDAADGCESPCVGSAERCNDADDDCDGDVDEDFAELGTACVAGLGACQSPGVDVCLPDGSGTRCNGVPGLPEAETCNGADDDCNGTVDDGFDRDRDGVTTCGGDCDDAAVDVHPGARETCNRLDDNCNDSVDEGFDLQTDPAHCGLCGRICQAPNAATACVGGVCVISNCAPGLFDADRRLEDGCEYACTPSVPSVERCDGRDDDCDGRTDEDFSIGAICQGAGQCGRGTFECFAGGLGGCSSDRGGSAYGGRAEACNALDDDCDGATDEDFDPLTDPRNCGACGVDCDQPAARSACVDGACRITSCVDGFLDLDPRAPGCEYGCRPSNPPTEACDGRDNDCDGEADEGFDVGLRCVGEGQCGVGERACTLDGLDALCSTEPGGPADQSRPEQCNGRDDDCDGDVDEAVDPSFVANDTRNCGACNQVCLPPVNGVPTCAGGTCGFRCEPGFIDADALEANGCETACVVQAPILVAEPTFAAVNAAIAGAPPCAIIALPDGVITGRAGGALHERQIVLDKPGLVLTAADGAAPVLTPGVADTAVSVIANDVTVERLHFDLYNARAVLAPDVRNVVLRDLSFDRVLMDCAGALPPTSDVVRLERTVGAVLERWQVPPHVGGQPLRVFVQLDRDSCPDRGASFLALDATSSTTLRQISLRAAHFSARSRASILSLRLSADTEISDSVFRLGAVHSETFGTGHAIYLDRSDRTLVQRSDFFDFPDGGPVSVYVGIRLDGRANRVESCTFGFEVENNGRTCITQAVELSDPAQAQVTNCSFHDLPFGVISTPGPQSLVGETLAYPALPTNYGAWVLVNGTGVDVRGNDLKLTYGSDVCSPGPQNPPVAESAGLVTLIGAREVTVEGNRIDLGGTYAENGCGAAALSLIAPTAATIADNFVVPPDALNVRGCSLVRTIDARAVAQGLRLERGQDVTVRGLGLPPGASWHGQPADAFWVVGRGTRNLRLEQVDGARIGLVETSAVTVEGGRLPIVESLVNTGVLVAGADMDTLKSRSDIAPRFVGNRVRTGMYVDHSRSPEILDNDIGPNPCGGAGFEFYRAGLTVASENGTLTGNRICGPTGLVLLFLGVDGAHEERLISHNRIEFTERGVLLDRFGWVADRITLRGIGAGATRAFDAFGLRSPAQPLRPILPFRMTNSVVTGTRRLIQPPNVIGFEGTLTYTALDPGAEAPPAFLGPGPGVVQVDCAVLPDLHLAPGSPCIDAGDPATPVGAEPLPNGGRVNLGAFGGTTEAEVSGP